MPAQSLHHLGDEPIYCEAVHNQEDDVYSGSDDDYYEGKLHRRLHIEKKALDFLNGHVPVLVSARLRGPFDRQHWNNPWISRRAIRQAGNPATKTTLSNLPVEGARGHGPDQVSEGNLPNTQGTSLYPLPSPEITNPPSARKNPYMEEEDYDRIKTWRETVKGTSISKDPFWLSQQDELDDISVTRKRSADHQWLHKRESKRRKPTEMRTSPPEESPSQAVSKMRKHEARRPQLVTLSARSTSAHEDELATDVNTKNATIASRLANRSIGTPRSRRIERRSPHRKPRLQGADSSEDELSMPSTTPTHKASFPLSGYPDSPKVDGSPRMPKTASMGISPSYSRREQPSIGRTQVEKIEASQLSVKQRSNIDVARGLSKDAAKMGMKAAGGVGESPRQEAAKPVQTEKVEAYSAARNPQTYTKTLANVALSQQDNSFCFHKTAKSPVELFASHPSTKVPMDAANPNLSSRKPHVAAATAGPTNGENRGSHGEESDDAGSLASDLVDAITVDNNAKQQIPCKPVVDSEKTVDARVAEQAQSANEVIENDDSAKEDENNEIDGHEAEDVARSHGMLEAIADVEFANNAGSVRNFESGIEAMAADKPQVVDQDDGCTPSDPEWSRYLNIQDQLSTSATKEAVIEAAHVPVVEQNFDDSSDSEWSSYVDTQDLSGVCPEAGVPIEDAQSLPTVVYQGSDVSTDPEWSTFLNTQDRSAAAEHQHEEPESDYKDAMDLDCTNPADCTPIMEEDGDLDSGWCTSRGTSSQPDGHQTGDNNQEPASPGALQDVRPWQASVGSIVDAYADTEQASRMFNPDGENVVSHESYQDFINSMAGPDVAEESSVVWEQGETAIDHTYMTPMEIEEAKNDSTEGSSTKAGGFDETTTSTESQQMADACGLDDNIKPRPVQSQPNIELQTPQAAENGADTTADPSFLDQATASIEPPHCQDSWAKKDGTRLQVPQAPPGTGTKPNVYPGFVAVTMPSTEPLEIQSPWAKETGIGLLPLAAQAVIEKDAPLDGSSSTLSVLADKALASSRLPQSPWMACLPTPSNLPTPDFELSIKAFSDFATPSPTKKRSSFNGSILRDRFKTPVFQKPRRRVHFAPLLGQEVSGDMDIGQHHDVSIYVEEDVSYLTPGGHKTGTIRVPRPATRASSPPPMDVSSAEVGGLLDHGSKFAKHFEAVAKRTKNPPRKALRLLPSESQQTTTASQGAGAMAEAFVQASQMRRKALEMAEVDATEATATGGSLDVSSEKTFSPVLVDPMEAQENIEPVDDVSAVLDNLGEFLDNTWGLGAGVEGEEDTGAQAQPRTPQGRQGARRVFDMIGDPMTALNFNAWAD